MRPYQRYLLALLLAILACNLLDRWALGLVLQDIKGDLHLTDTQLGLLSGIAFAIFYAVMGIPIARWADRGNRATIIALSAALWGLAVSFCGMAASFAQLLLIRIGVAVGEAGGYVPAFSLLADYFSRAERPRAIAVFGLGSPLSIMVGYWLAGWLNEAFGWRVMFILLGVPGLLLAGVVRLTLREPRAQQRRLESPSHRANLAMKDSPSTVDAAGRQPTLTEVCRRLWGTPTFRHLMVCMSIMFFFQFGIMQWQPTFFIRSYGLTSTEVGTWFALIYGVGGGLGSYLGGELSSRYAAHNERLQLIATAIAILIFGVLQTGVFVSSNAYFAFGLMVPVGIAQLAINAPLYATMQTLVPERMRAQAVALVLLFANLIGLGLGPLATGTLSDVLRPWTGEESLRYALLILAPGFSLVAWYTLRASKTVMGDLAAMSTETEGAASVSTQGAFSSGDR